MIYSHLYGCLVIMKSCTILIEPPLDEDIDTKDLVCATAGGVKVRQTVDGSFPHQSCNPVYIRDQFAYWRQSHVSPKAV